MKTGIVLLATIPVLLLWAAQNHEVSSRRQAFPPREYLRIKLLIHPQGLVE
jgi:hypothetical protein